MDADSDKRAHAIMVKWALRHRLWVLVMVVLVTIASAYFALRVQFSNSIEMWFMESDPELLVYDEFSELFGGDEIAIIGVHANDVFSRDVLQSIERITDAAKEASHVISVRSLTSEVINAPIGEIPEAGLQILRERAMNSDLINGWLVFDDARATPVLVEMNRAGNTVEGKASLVKALHGIIDRERVRNPDLDLFVSGTPVLDDAFFRYNNRDMSLMLPLAVGLVLAAGLIAFRRFSATMLMLLVVVLAVVWVFGLMGALGLDMSILTSALPPLLLAIGVANSVHVISDYHRRLRCGAIARIRAIEEGLIHLLAPCTFTSLTTALGLLSLALSPLRPIREFGFLAASGVLFAYVLSMTFLPVMLSLLPGMASYPKKRKHSLFLDWILTSLGKPSLKVSRGLVVFSMILLIVSIGLITRLQVGVYALSWFPKDDPVVVDIERTDRELGGSSSLEFLLKAPEGGLLDPDLLMQIYQFERWLELNIPGVTGTLSIADQLNATLDLSGDSAIKLTREQVETQLTLLRESHGENITRLINPDHSVGRITARIRLDQLPSVVEAFGEIDHRARTQLEAHNVTIQMTGYVRLMGKMEDYLIISQIWSFALAFGVISLMMVVFLRSWPLGMLAMIPNLLPVAMGLACMSLLEISLNPGTIMIGAIALGLVVDDTIHFLVALRRNLEGASNLDKAIAGAVHTAGRPIIITSIILIIGFGILAFGSFSPNIHFGIVCALVIAFALICDLLLLPAALKTLKPILLDKFHL